MAMLPGNLVPILTGKLVPILTGKLVPLLTGNLVAVLGWESAMRTGPAVLGGNLLCVLARIFLFTHRCRNILIPNHTLNLWVISNLVTMPALK